MGVTIQFGISPITIAAVCLCLIALLHKGHSLNCYECNSKYDPNCGEPFKNHTIALTDCSQRFLKQYPDVPGTICRKIVQKVREETRVIRSCGYLNPDGEGRCFSRAGTHQVFMYYCHCDSGDGCNTASGPWEPSLWSSSKYALLTLAAIAKF